MMKKLIWVNFLTHCKLLFRENQSGYHSIPETAFSSIHIQMFSYLTSESISLLY